MELTDLSATRSRASKPNTPLAFVSMPFKDLRHPPIQFGILGQCLERAGITVRTHSLELAFMEHLRAQTCERPEGERLTVADYLRVVSEDFIVHLGDWIFKVAPYADRVSDDEGYLAYLRAKGYSKESISKAVQMRSHVPEFLAAAADEVLAGSPRVVGFSTTFQQNIPCLVLAKILKIKDPSLTVVFGGDNCDNVMGPTLHECFPWIDVVVRGEGEKVLVEVVTDVLAGRPIRPQPGLCYRAGGRSIIVPEESSPQLLMADVPSPTYDDYFDHLEHSPLRSELWPQVAIVFESSRGCWWGAKSHCTFCGLNSATMQFRSKSATRVAEEIFRLAARHKVLDFIAVDDIIDLAHIRDLLPMLQRSGCDFQFFYETKSNLTKEQVRAFRNAGVSSVQPGIESLSTPILRLMRKGVTGLQNIRLLKWCAEMGVVPVWNILYGFPGEPPEEYDRIAQLIPSLIHLSPPNVMPIQLQRFSPYFERPGDFGLEIEGPMPYYRFLYDVAPDALADLVYNFEYSYLDGRDPQSYTGRLREAVAQWRALSAEGSCSLSYRRGPGFVIVEDQRPGFESATYQFDGPEAKIYLGCDAGATVNGLRSQLIASGGELLSTDEIEAFLVDLVDDGIVYREENTFLSLAIASSDTQGTPSRPMDVLSATSLRGSAEVGKEYVDAT